jgi:hypothetical protein
MTNLKLNLTLIASLLLCACNSVASRPLPEPVSGEKARIRVLYTGGGAMTASPNSDCYAPSDINSGIIVGVAITGDVGHKGKKIGMPPGSQLAGAWLNAEFYAAAGQPITFAMRTGHSIPFCRFTKRFTPEANKDYELIAWADSIKGQCDAELRSLTDKASVLMENAPHCK